MSNRTLFIIILVIVLIAVLPVWGYSAAWGYYPGGFVGLLLIILLIAVLTGNL